ncbi:MAG: hypothetical protein IPI23_11215 [Bacteroidetes bacterium]|nr:hypothetical protein [Bacteroidota bacterium]
MKLFRTLFLFLHLVLSFGTCKPNEETCVWDSAAMDFNGGTRFHLQVLSSRGSCVSIANTNGDLLLYPVGFVPNNSWHKFLIDPSGITAMPIQNLGTLNQTNSGNLSVNAEGTKLRL